MLTKLPRQRELNFRSPLIVLMASASSIKFDLQDYALLRRYRHVGINETHFMHKGVQNLYYSHLELARTLEYHQGCVNTVDWDEQGRFLLTGSDDTRIAIWDYQGGEMDRPKAEVGTGHTQNIFSARFFPGGKRIATAAGDSDVRVFDTETLTCTHHFECFGGRAKRVDFEGGNPNWMIACSEDGTVRQWDVRVEMSCMDEGVCPNIVLDSHPAPVEFMSLSVSPIRPNYFAIGGDEPVVRIYDRRFLSGFDNFVRAWTPLESSRKVITGVRFANDNMDLIASFSEGGIHLVNIMDPLEPANRVTKDNILFREDNLLQGKEFIRPLTECLGRLEGELREVEALSENKQYFEEIEKLGSVIQSLTAYIDIPQWQVILSLLYYNRALAMARYASIQEGTGEGYEENPMDNIQANLTRALWVSAELSNEEVYLLDALTEVWHGSIQHAAHILIDHLLPDDSHERSLTSTQSMDPLQLAGELTLLQRCGLDLYRSIVMPKLGSNQQDRVPWSVLRDYLQILSSKSVLRSRQWEDMKGSREVITATTRLFSSHINKETVKDVSFVGPNSEFVATGSDGGLAFLWNRYTGELVWLAKADRFACNMLQSHPSLPVLATCGIDSEVKLWEYSGAVPKSNHRSVLCRVRGEDMPEAIWSAEEGRDQDVSRLSGIEITIMGSEPVQCPLQ